MRFPEVTDLRSLIEHGIHVFDLMALLDEMLTN
jgi:hypothetical protein